MAYRLSLGSVSAYQRRRSPESRVKSVSTLGIMALTAANIRPAKSSAGAARLHGIGRSSAVTLTCLKSIRSSSPFQSGEVRRLRRAAFFNSASETR